MVAAVVGAAFLVTMPQVTVFLLSSAFVLSGPYLLLRGERIPSRVSMLPVDAEPHSAPVDSDSRGSFEVPD